MRDASSWCSLCGSSKNKDPSKMFHRFPLDEERCQEWLQICELQRLAEKTSLYLNKNRRLCSDHFSADAYAGNRLKSGAVPNRNISSSSSYRSGKTTIAEKIRLLNEATSSDLNTLQSQLSIITASKSSSDNLGREGRPISTTGTVRNILKPLNTQLLQTTSLPCQNEKTDDTLLRVPAPHNETQNGGIVLPKNLKAAPITVLRVFTVPIKEALEGRGVKTLSNGCPIESKSLSEKANSSRDIQIGEIYANYNDHGAGTTESVSNASTSIINRQLLVTDRSPQPVHPEKPVWKRFTMNSPAVVKSIAPIKKPQEYRPACSCKCKCRTCQSPTLLKAKLTEARLLLRKAQRCVTRLKSNIQKMQEKKRRAITQRQLIAAMKDHLNETTYEFFLGQLSYKKKHGMRWGSELKHVMLKLYRDSPRGYRMLQKLFTLPSGGILVRHERELKELVHLENELFYEQVAISEKETSVNGIAEECEMDDTGDDSTGNDEQEAESEHEGDQCQDVAFDDSSEGDEIQLDSVDNNSIQISVVSEKL